MQATRGRSQPWAALPASRAAEKESSAHLREQCRVAGQRRIRSGMLAIPTWYISGICTVLCLVESVKGLAPYYVYFGYLYRTLSGRIRPGLAPYLVHFGDLYRTLPGRIRSGLGPY